MTHMYVEDSTQRDTTWREYYIDRWFSIDMAQHSGDVLAGMCGDSQWPYSKINATDLTNTTMKVIKVYLDPFAQTVSKTNTNKWSSIASDIGGAASLAYSIT